MAGAGSLLLALPDPCLLRVLQCCAAADQCSLFGAARAHSRLHQAAVVALRSITAQVSQQQQMDGIMLYFTKHGQHVNSVDIRGDEHDNSQVSLSQLPPQLQLSILQLEDLSLQLQPGNDSQGVLGSAAAVAALKQLRLTHCQLLDDGVNGALAAALSLLPAGLEHLTINDPLGGQGHRVQFPAGVLQQLPHLTYLELCGVDVVGPDEASPALQPLQALTRLAGLKLDGVQAVMTSSILSGLQHLTRLDLSTELEPAALAGMTQLQHLALFACLMRGGAAGAAQLLSYLQPLQQLTHLNVVHSLWAVEGSSPPASAYAALTASSKLQHLDVGYCTLPAGVWQHVFPVGRQLPNLQSLRVPFVKQPLTAPGEYAQPEGSRLVSCCPGLQSLHMGSRHCRAQSLASLQGLSGLQTLHCNWDGATPEVVQAVCQLTGLRELDVLNPGRMKEEGLLLQLTQLQQLTKLHCCNGGCAADQIDLSGGVEHVWRQLARLHLDHPNPGVAQQAAAALVDSQ